jgi:hypothetical protein
LEEAKNLVLKFKKFSGKMKLVEKNKTLLVLVVVLAIVGLVFLMSSPTVSRQPSTKRVLDYLNQHDTTISSTDVVITEVEFLRQRHIDEEEKSFGLDGATFFTWTEKPYEEYIYLATTNEGIEFLVFYRANREQFGTNFESVYHGFKTMEKSEQKIESGLANLVISKEYRCKDEIFTSSFDWQTAFRESLRDSNIDWYEYTWYGCDLIVKLNTDLTTLRQSYRGEIEGILKDSLSVVFITNDNTRVQSISGFDDDFRVYVVFGQSAFWGREEDF